MLIQINFIMGVNIGFEFVYDEEDEEEWLIIDLAIFRLMIGRLI